MSYILMHVRKSFLKELVIIIIVTAAYVVEPIAVGNLGPLSASALEFISNLGQRISNFSGDDREIQFLFQCISVTIQHFNSLPLRDSFSMDLPALFLTFVFSCREPFLVVMIITPQRHHVCWLAKELIHTTLASYLPSCQIFNYQTANVRPSQLCLPGELSIHPLLTSGTV